MEDLDDEILRLIEKADKIVYLEELEQRKILALNDAREVDGRIKIKLEQLHEEKKSIKDAIVEYDQIIEDNWDIIQLEQQYEGQHLREQFNQLETYTFARHSKFSQRLAEILNEFYITDRSDLDDLLDENMSRIEKIEQERLDNQQKIIKLIKEINSILEKN